LINFKLKLLQTDNNNKDIYKKKKIPDYLSNNSTKDNTLQITSLVNEDNHSTRRYKKLASNTNSNNKNSNSFTNNPEQQSLKITPSLPPKLPEKNEKNTIQPEQFKINRVNDFEINNKLKIHEKLYKDYIRRDIVQDDLIKTFRNQEIRECTFTPKINYTSINSKSKEPKHIELYQVN
jgi:hypothetical protein